MDSKRTTWPTLGNPDLVYHAVCRKSANKKVGCRQSAPRQQGQAKLNFWMLGRQHPLVVFQKILKNCLISIYLLIQKRVKLKTIKKIESIQTSPHHLGGGNLNLRKFPSLLLGNTLLVAPRPLRRHHLAPGNDLVARVVVAWGGRRHLGALLLHERAL